MPLFLTQGLRAVSLGEKICSSTVLMSLSMAKQRTASVDPNLHPSVEERLRSTVARPSRGVSLPAMTSLSVKQTGSLGWDVIQYCGLPRCRAGSYAYPLVALDASCRASNAHPRLGQRRKKLWRMVARRRFEECRPGVHRDRLRML